MERVGIYATFASIQQTALVFIALVGGGLLYGQLSASIHRSHTLPSAGWILVPVACMLLGTILERRTPWPLLDPRSQSWAFLVYDLMLSPVAAWCCARAWRHSSLIPEYAKSSWWVVACYLLGFAGGLAFHLHDVAAYHAIGDSATLLLASPTKIFHDFLVFPVLLGGMLYAAVPLLWSQENRPVAFMAMAFAIIWAILSVLSPVKVSALHEPWNPGLFQSAAVDR